VPDDISLQTKPAIALRPIRAAVEEGLPPALVDSRIGDRLDGSERLCVRLRVAAVLDAGVANAGPGPAQQRSRSLSKISRVRDHELAENSVAGFGAVGKAGQSFGGDTVKECSLPANPS